MQDVLQKLVNVVSRGAELPGRASTALHRRPDIELPAAKKHLFADTKLPSIQKSAQVNTKEEEEREERFGQDLLALELKERIAMLRSPDAKPSPEASQKTQHKHNPFRSASSVYYLLLDLAERFPSLRRFIGGIYVPRETNRE